MKHIRFYQALSLSLLSALALAALTGCGASGDENDPSVNGDTENGDNVEVTHILVGTAAMPAPYGWVNEDGSIGGYDQAVIQAVDDLLPQYEFELEVVDFASLFSGIDSDRYQMVANNISKTAEREERYYFDTESYIYNTMAIIFQKGRTDIQSPADLGGKSANTNSNGVTFQLYLEAYNEANPEQPIDISYSDIDTLARLQQVEDGAYDFYVCEVAILNYYIKEYGLDLDYIVLDPEDAYGLLDLQSYHLYPKTNEGAALRDAVSGAIKTLKENGTISKLSQEYFGFDMYEVNA